MENAVSKGYVNSYYIYNAVRFKCDKRANVVENKKLVSIARLSQDKSIDLMVDIVMEVFKDKKYKNWTLELYGDGEEENKLRSMISDNKQIKLMGLTNNPKDVLLTSSINLNTSKYEGFSLSILEANECGVPTIAFNFGESTSEQILNGKTGIIALDRDDYVKKLKELMDNYDKLEELSNNAKKFSKDFQIEKIISKWIKLFEEIK
jgi:glycosyltransferase involved in cell wall biosynthesis